MNSEASTEGIVILNLMEKIYNSCHGILEGRIIICTENKTVLKNIVNIKTKLSQYACDYSAIYSRIEEILE